MDNLIRAGALLICDGAHSVGLCCQMEHTHLCPLKMLGPDCRDGVLQAAIYQEQSLFFSKREYEESEFQQPDRSLVYLMSRIRCPWLSRKVINAEAGVTIHLSDLITDDLEPERHCPITLSFLYFNRFFAEAERNTDAHLMTLVIPSSCCVPAGVK